MSKRAKSSGSDKEKYEKEQKIKTDIISNLRDVDSLRTSLKKIKPIPIKDIFGNEQLNPKKILTNTALDRVLSYNGGIELGSSVEFWGSFATGKTQICQTLAVEAEGRIIYIDAEHTFRSRRIQQICNSRGKDPEEVASRILVYQPNDWMEQEGIIANLPEYDDDGNFLDVGLIILDSLMVHWGSAPEFFGRDRNTVRQQLIKNELQDLVRYARRHNGVFVFTNQVMANPVDTRYLPPEEKVRDRGGPTVEHFADYRIFLRKGFGNLRYARVVDCIDLPLLEVPFILDESGILDIPDPVERAKAVVSSNDYFNRFTSGQVGSKPAGKEYIKTALELGFITDVESEGLGLTKDDIQKILDKRQTTYEDRLNLLSGEEKEILDMDTEYEKLEEENDKET